MEGAAIDQLTNRLTFEKEDHVIKMSLIGGVYLIWERFPKV